MLTQARDWFDEPAQVEHYGNEAAAGPTAAEIRLLQALPDSGRILDLGTGAGRIAFYLADKGYDVTGVVVSEPLLPAARELVAQRQPRVAFHRVEPLTLPFETASFDSALAIKVHCYIPSRAGRRAYLDEVGRVLRPGAPLLLVSYVVPAEREAIDALDADQDHHLRAASRFRTREPLDTFPAGRGYVHWFPTEALHDELSSSPSFEIQDITEDTPGGLLRLVVLRRRA